MQSNRSLTILIEGAILALMATLLSYIPITYGGVIALVYGGIPMTLYALKRGLRPALLACFMWGLLQFVMGNAIILSPIQFIVEYPIAFAFNGFAGLFYTGFQRADQSGNQAQAYWAIVWASLVGTALRYVWHFIGGVVFWSQYAPEGVSPYWFSFVPNAISVPLTAIPIILVLILLYRVSPRLFRP